MDAVTYVRDKKHALRGMLLVYRGLIDQKVIEDPPFDLDQIAAMLADDVKELGLAWGVAANDAMVMPRRYLPALNCSCWA